MGQDYFIEETELAFNVRCHNKNYFSLPYPALRGIKQKENAALAIAILDTLTLDFPLGLNHIKIGLLQSSIIGRFQVLPGTPQTILDVAHNPDAVAHMLKNMLEFPASKNTLAVFGIAKDKDVAKIIFNCRDKFDKWFIAKISSGRGMRADEIALILFANGVKKEQIIICDSITEAYTKASSVADNNDRIIAFGSFLVVEEVYLSLEKKKHNAG